jgi:Zinc knuckle
MPAKAKPTTGRSSNDEISTGPAGDAVVQNILDEDRSLSQYDAENRKYKIDSAMLEQLNVAVQENNDPIAIHLLRLLVRQAEEVDRVVVSPSLFKKLDDREAEMQQTKRELLAAQTRTLTLEDSRDQLALELQEDRATISRLMRSRVSASPAPAEPRPQRSAKIADPDILTDGKKDPKLRFWLSRMRNKLTVNADHFADETARIAYVENRTDDVAASHIAPRMESSSPNPWASAEEMLDHLEEALGDPNREQNARSDFRALKMRAGIDINDFLGKFMLLATEGRVPQETWKEELNEKLTPKLQELVLYSYNTSSFYEFQQSVRRAAQTLEKNRKALASRQSTPTGSDTNPRRSYTPSGGQPSTESRTKLLREGRCFICKEVGHLGRDCPTHKKLLDLKHLETVALVEEPKKEHP